jgi:hypothetical protein
VFLGGESIEVFDLASRLRYHLCRVAMAMQKSVQKVMRDSALKAPCHIAILAIVGEMARNLKENISKVKLEPLPYPLSVNPTRNVAGIGTQA